MSLGGDDRFSGPQEAHPSLPDDAAARTAKIIPIRTALDASSAPVDNPFVRFADAEASVAQAKIAEPLPVEPSLREEGKSRAPGSTVVIEQPVPAPPLQTGGDSDGGGSSGSGGGGGGGGGAPPLHRRSSDHEFRDVLGTALPEPASIS